MLGLQLFRTSQITIDCDECHRRFEAYRGGVCEACRRILCGDCLHGSWARRMAVEFGARPVCIQCRSAHAGAEAGSAVDH
ncbi:MAG: hypothetical protein ACREOJ_15495 [Gemmatimonadaceae bacterium]